jgi:hypothetical protein
MCGGVEDIETVYLLGLDHCHSPCYGFALDFLAQKVAATLGELLGVVEERVGITVGEYDGSGYHGSCQGTAPGLVASRLKAARYDVEG